MPQNQDGQQKPLNEGSEKSGGKNNAPRTPKPDVKPPAQKPQKNA